MGMGVVWLDIPFGWQDGPCPMHLSLVLKHLKDAPCIFLIHFFFQGCETRLFFGDITVILGARAIVSEKSS